MTASFVDRDMYMRFRGGGIGHVKVDIDDPIPEDINPLDSADNIDEATDTGRDNSGDLEGDGEDEDELEEDEQGEDEEDDLEEEQDEVGETYVGGDDIEGDDSEIVNLVNDTLGYADL